MKAEKVDVKTIKITELSTHADGIKIPSEIIIVVDYIGPPSCKKGIALDNIIVPLIVDALNKTN